MSIEKEGDSERINQYLVGAKLGSGAYSKVRLAKRDDHTYAIKIVDKKHLQKQSRTFYNESGGMETSTYLELIYNEISIHA